MVESSKKNTIITKKIIREIETINRFVAGMDESDFLVDDKTQRAVAMTLINIGELSKAYTDDFLYSKTAIPQFESGCRFQKIPIDKISRGFFLASKNKSKNQSTITSLLAHPTAHVYPQFCALVL